MDLITTGRSASSRGRLADLTRELLALLSGPNVGASIKFSQLLIQMQQQSSVPIEPEELRDSLAFLIQDEQVAVSGSARNETIRILKK